MCEINPFMKFLSKTRAKNLRLHTQVTIGKTPFTEVHHYQNLPSQLLKRDVRVDVYLPPGYYPAGQKSYPVLFFNDGQDMEAARIPETLDELYAAGRIAHLILVAIHAGDRLQEYGTANHPDYKHRGSKADAYTRFLINELRPFLQARYQLSTHPAENVIAGFSLGGLSAMDIAWHYPDKFARVGVFSGSFWWRSKASVPEDPDANRIMHEIISQSHHRPGMRFWFQCGTNDETEDRNNNGIIDSIDDTLDLIRELKKLSYKEGRDIHYLEVIDGEHNHGTWAKVMPDFLVWAFGK